MTTNTHSTTIHLIVHSHLIYQSSFAFEAFSSFHFRNHVLPGGESDGYLASVASQPNHLQFLPTRTWPQLPFHVSHADKLAGVPVFPLTVHNASVYSAFFFFSVTRSPGHQPDAAVFSPIMPRLDTEEARDARPRHHGRTLCLPRPCSPRWLQPHG